MITIAQAGIGTWGQNHTRIFSSLKDCRLKMCCDKNKETLEKLKDNYAGKIKLTDNFNDILKDREIEGVVITTPAATHGRFSIQALSCGKHVFVEKPMALNIKDAREMLRVARKNKRVLLVGHLLLYHPAVRKLKSYIDDGILGKIQYLYSTRVNLGQVRSEENALWSLTAHDISVTLYLLNQMPDEVSTSGMSYIRKKVEDVVFVTLNFKNRIMAHIHASWLDPHKIRKFTIVGTKKMVVFDDMESSEKIRIYDKGFDWQKNYGSYETFLLLRQGDINIPKIDIAEPLKIECKHFIDCIKNKSRPFTGGLDGLAVLKVLSAAGESLRKNGKFIKI